MRPFRDSTGGNDGLAGANGRGNGPIAGIVEADVEKAAYALSLASARDRPTIGAIPKLPLAQMIVAEAARHAGCI